MFWKNIFKKAKPSMPLGAKNNLFQNTSKRPNWVCSQCLKTDSHYLPPIGIKDGRDLKTTKTDLIKTMLSRPNTELITDSDNYLHFIEISNFWGFVDDIEFVILTEEKLIHFRSSSRTGQSDLGVNRKRMEEVIKSI